MRLTALLGIIAMGLATGCANPSIEASDYSKACAHDGDCTVVFEGDVCLCDVERTPAAIALAARPAWSADFDALAAECGGPDASCPPSPTRRARCMASACVLAP
jgi:hypothetical protein